MAKQKPKTIKHVLETTKSVSIKSVPAPPDTKSWIEYTWKEKQETPKRIEDAATALAAMVSVSLALFIAIGEDAFKSYKGSWQIVTAVIVWLCSLVVSFFTLFPWRYRFASESVQSIKRMHGKIILVKGALLVLSLMLFLLALVLLCVQFFA